MPRITSPAQSRIETKKRSNGAISRAILRHIVVHPGVRRDALMAAAVALHPEAGYRQITKAVWDLINISKAVTQQGDRDNHAYFPTEVVRLDPPQIERLNHFLARVMPAGMTA